MLQQKGGTTFQEIHEQPQLWADALSKVIPLRSEWTAWMKAGGLDQVVFVGCGSSHFIGLVASRALAKAGLPALAVVASDLLYAPSTALAKGRKTLLVAVSRSGETSETVWAVEKAKAFLPEGLKVLALTCKEGSALERLAQKTFVFPAALEQGPVMTKSFTVLLLALLALCADLTGNTALAGDLQKLPELLDIKKHQSAIQQIAAGKFQNWVFLGSGAHFGLACEGMLKMQEMAMTIADAYPAAELRHGYGASMSPSTMTVLVQSPSMRSLEDEVLRDLAVYQCQVILCCDEEDDRLRASADTIFEYKSGLRTEEAQGLLAVPILQLLAFYHSLSKGHNPDKSKNLVPVVTLKEKP